VQQVFNLHQILLTCVDLDLSLHPMSVPYVFLVTLRGGARICSSPPQLIGSSYPRALLPTRPQTWRSWSSSVPNKKNVSDDHDASVESSSTSARPSLGNGMEWRKQQLDKLEEKFTSSSPSFSEPSVHVDNDEDLQPMWKQMESRVIRRRPRTIEEMGGRTGRKNVKKTDEEMWLSEGLYDNEPKP